MKSDSLADYERAAQKTAFHLLVERVGGYDLAAMIAGRAASVLHGYGNLHHASFAPVDVVVRLERAFVAMGGRPLVSALMARQVGYQQIPVEVGSGELGRAAAALLREAAELAAAHLEAMEDGALTDAERATLAEHLDSLMDAATRCRGILGGPPLPIAAKGARPCAA
ncbi:hypothetical protein [Falsiroseomonas selenitidurans]|uniref:Uncharacterized protein n=1 Tax=Falsiroseomonas selenitidurans TaxID=2716335 RepID=A0ABX1E8G4_9PROT|nr:hypothetical protein [Falsiroseomonas selenitidurans]NKC33482.1 hypothetical protein [Falsiroseomonas selenitidurans]